MSRAGWLAVVVGVIGLLGVIGGAPDARADFPVPLILRADAELDRLTIWGLNFGTATPVVKLAGVALPVLTYSPTQIVAGLPAGIEAASYQLPVFRGLVPAL